jgi:ferredoxin
MSTDHEHRVCTYREAEETLRAHETVYVNDCFCRLPAKQGKAKWAWCGHPVRTCMGFTPPRDAVYEFDIVPRERAIEMMEDWKRLGGFFRFMEDRNWICFCCGCGCGWFRDESGSRVSDPCRKSPFLERTDAEGCNLCGDCIPVCAYEARRIEDGRMVVESEKCYGCSACEHACPEAVIVMVPRET